MRTDALGRGRRTRAPSTPLVAAVVAVLSCACGPEVASVDNFGGSAGGFGVGGFAGTGGAAGSGGQLPPCPPEPSGLVPGCAYGLIDADADGYGDSQRPHACCGNVVDLSTADCDDTDPTRAAGAFPDGDGDGLGTGAPVCSARPPPIGFSLRSGDCDDANRSIDWQGSADCPCERFLFDAAVPMNPDCATEPDLFVVDHQVCDFNCGQSLAFRLGNAGGAAPQGPIQVSMTVQAQQATFDLEPMGPGNLSGWRRVPFLGFTGPATVTIVSPISDCTSRRSPFEVELARVCGP